MNYDSYVKQTNNSMDWPYEVKYGEEKEIKVDVVVIGGGMAGCYAAISAAKRGAKVAVLDKGPIKKSGSCGEGIDHWLNIATNPCSKITPEKLVEETAKFKGNKYAMSHLNYIEYKESWDALQELEKMGVPIRDEDDEFKGSPFRDDETKILFAYDYDTKYHCRLRGGAKLKGCLDKELRRLGVQIFNFTMGTSLLTDNGKAGGRVIGATAIDVRTGEFLIFHAKAAIIATSKPQGYWVFSTELNGGASKFLDPNNTGEGHAMAFEVGAELTMMEKSFQSHASSGGFRYPDYGVGDSKNTWYACPIVDANGKYIPRIDGAGNVIETLEQHYRQTPGHGKYRSGQMYFFKPDFAEKIKNGEYTLPLYADISAMPPDEQRAIWGLMVGNEGKTRIPIYETYNKNGFDPSKDMLMVPIAPPAHYGNEYVPWWAGISPYQWREIPMGAGVIALDWDLRPLNTEGLYVAGSTSTETYGSAAAATGRYAGRKASTYAKTISEGVISREQIEKEKARIYAPVTRKDGIGWKELKAGLCRVMQDYCNEIKNEEILNIGLKWFESIEECEAQEVYARNPHELARVIECFTHLTMGKVIIHACLARKASSNGLIFNRLDYPEVDPPEWNKFITIRKENSEIKTRDLEFDYWLKPPYAPTYKENYDEHCDL